MVSRDTTVHVLVVALSVVVLSALDALLPDVQSATFTVLALLLYGVVLAGAHLVLALLGDDGLVPVRSRWRFVGVVALVLALLGVVVLADPVRIAGVSSDTVAAVLVVGVFLGYWALEASAGYRDTGA